MGRKKPIRRGVKRGHFTGTKGGGRTGAPKRRGDPEERGKRKAERKRRARERREEMEALKLRILNQREKTHLPPGPVGPDNVFGHGGIGEAPE